MDFGMDVSRIFRWIKDGLRMDAAEMELNGLDYGWMDPKRMKHESITPFKYGSRTD